jgi:hypothetical protein
VHAQCTIGSDTRPFGPIGALAHHLFVRHDLERMFDFRRDAFA